MSSASGDLSREMSGDTSDKREMSGDMSDRREVSGDMSCKRELASARKDCILPLASLTITIGTDILHI